MSDHGIDGLGEFLEKAKRGGGKGGPFVGPKGGLWADPKHTVHWDPKVHGPGQLSLPARAPVAAPAAQEKLDYPAPRISSHWHTASAAEHDAAAETITKLIPRAGAGTEEARQLEDDRIWHQQRAHTKRQAPGAATPGKPFAGGNVGDSAPFPHIPNRGEVEGLEVGDLAVNAYGRLAPVAEVTFRGVDGHGKAYVGYTTGTAGGGTTSMSIKEDELTRHVAASGRHTSAELDRIEWESVAPERRHGGMRGAPLGFKIAEEKRVREVAKPTGQPTAAEMANMRGPEEMVPHIGIEEANRRAADAHTAQVNLANQERDKAHAEWKRLTAEGHERGAPVLEAARSRAQMHSLLADHHQAARAAIDPKLNDTERAQHRRDAKRFKEEADQAAAEHEVHADRMHREAKINPTHMPLNKLVSDAHRDFASAGNADHGTSEKAARYGEAAIGYEMASQLHASRGDKTASQSFREAAKKARELQSEHANIASERGRAKTLAVPPKSLAEFKGWSEAQHKAAAAALEKVGPHHQEYATSHLLRMHRALAEHQRNVAGGVPNPTVDRAEAAKHLKEALAAHREQHGAGEASTGPGSAAQALKEHQENVIKKLGMRDQIGHETYDAKASHAAYSKLARLHEGVAKEARAAGDTVQWAQSKRFAKYAKGQAAMHRNLIGEKSMDAIEALESFVKAAEVEAGEPLEKFLGFGGGGRGSGGGEGSRGGKIIGHTAQGKPIYESAATAASGAHAMTRTGKHITTGPAKGQSTSEWAAAHRKAGWTSQDHAEASDVHQKLMTHQHNMGNKEEAQKHRDAMTAHNLAFQGARKQEDAAAKQKKVGKAMSKAIEESAVGEGRVSTSRPGTRAMGVQTPEETVKARRPKNPAAAIKRRIMHPPKAESGVAKGDDGKPGESLGETSTAELRQTHDGILARLKQKPNDPALRSRYDAIEAELKRRNAHPEHETEKALPSASADITPEKARQILHDGEVHGKPLTDQQRKFFGAIGGHLPAPKARKSMDSIDVLGEYLAKADTSTTSPQPDAGESSKISGDNAAGAGPLPHGEPSLAGWGQEDGGKLEGAGKGDVGSGPNPPPTKGEKAEDGALSEDDVDVEQEMKPAGDSKFRGGQERMLSAKSLDNSYTQQELRHTVAHDNAIVASRLRKGPEDIIIKGGTPPTPVAPEREQPTTFRHGDVVTYSNAADLACEAIQKGDDFYHGPPPAIDATGTLRKSTTCAHGHTMSAALTACPQCGEGATMAKSDAVVPDGATLRNFGRGLMPRHEPDLVLPNGTTKPGQK